MPGQLMRLFHTARHLRFRQVCGRTRQRVSRIRPVSVRNSCTDVPAFRGCHWSEEKDFQPPLVAGIEVDAVQRGVFRFLQTPCEIGFPPRWEGDGQPRLWLYNLHYFDWLWSLDFIAARDVVRDWIRWHENRRDGVGWESYPISVRVINWCGYFFGRHRNETLNDRDFCQKLWGSLFAQCQWLQRHLEVHLLNNHYLENGAALTLAGCCFQGDEARHWFQRGKGILIEQLKEQILPDGMHFELSPMYHCRILYVLGLLRVAGEASVAELLEDPIRLMRGALRSICHPDGEIALFGDSALDVYPGLSALVTSEQESAIASHDEEKTGGAFALPEAGYYGWRDPQGTYLIADYGRIGPDFNPGHGHADMFSFELSLKGCRVITDCGVHDYDASETRRYCRSTAAHNTVEVESQDQCELWGAFRVARRGTPYGVVWRPGADGFVLEGKHDGYRRLPGKPMHRRKMRWDGRDGLLVCDTVTARRSVRCVSRLHLHPACRIVHRDRHSVRISYPEGSFLVETHADVRIEETPYFERFYDSQRRPCLCMAGHGASVELQYRIHL